MMMTPEVSVSSLRRGWFRYAFVLLLGLGPRGPRSDSRTPSEVIGRLSFKVSPAPFNYNDLALIENSRPPGVQPGSAPNLPCDSPSVHCDFSDSRCDSPSVHCDPSEGRCD